MTISASVDRGFDHLRGLEPSHDNLRALGQGLLAIVNAAILLAIVAVILSSNSRSPAIIASFFQFVSWLVAQVIKPLQPGVSVPLTSTLAPAFGGSPGQAPATGPTVTPSATPNSFPPGPTSQGLLPGTPTTGNTSVTPQTPTCFATINGSLQQIVANPDGSCPSS